MSEATCDESIYKVNVIEYAQSEPSITSRPGERVGIFIDEENLRLGMPKKTKFDPHEIVEYCRMNVGIPIMNRIYMKGKYVQPLNLMQCRDDYFEVTLVEDNKKDAADMEIIGDATEAIFCKPYISTYVIVTGDKDLSPLIRKLHKNGKNVIVIAHRQCISRKFIRMIEGLGHQFVDYLELTSGVRGE